MLMTWSLIGRRDPKAELSRQINAAAKKRAESAPTDAHDLRLMWVTDCQLQLEWSSVLLLHSALKVGQTGDFVRIATGCESAKSRKFVTDAMSTVAKIFNAEDRVIVHFAPKHVTDERDNTNGEVQAGCVQAQLVIVSALAGVYSILQGIRGTTLLGKRQATKPCWGVGV